MNIVKDYNGWYAYRVGGPTGVEYLHQDGKWYAHASYFRLKRKLMALLAFIYEL